MLGIEPRSHRRRPGRLPLRGLLWGVAVFCALQASVGLAVSRGWVPVRDPLFADKAALLDRCGDAFRTPTRPGKLFAVLALGSSRTLFAVDGERLGGLLSAARGPTAVVNFGLPVAGPVMNNLHLRRLLRDGRRPDLLLVEVLPAYLAGQVQPPMGVWLQPERYRDDEFARLSGWGFPLPRGPEDRWQHWFAGAHAYRAPLLARTAPQWVPTRESFASDSRHWADEHGWGLTTDDQVEPERYRQGLAHAWKQYRDALTGFRLGGTNCAALIDLLGLCRNECLPVALVLMPEATDFRAWYSADALAQVDRFLSALHVTYGCPVVDARGWVPDSGFSDGHHLLKPGARVFTEQLARGHLIPWLRDGLPMIGGIHARD